MKSFSRSCLSVLLSILMVVGCLSAAIIPGTITAGANNEGANVATWVAGDPAVRQAALNKLGAAIKAAEDAGALTQWAASGYSNPATATRSTACLTNGDWLSGGHPPGSGSAPGTGYWPIITDNSPGGFIIEIASAYLGLLELGIIQSDVQATIGNNTTGTSMAKVPFTWWTHLNRGLDHYYTTTNPAAFGGTNLVGMRNVLAALTNMLDYNGTATAGAMTQKAYGNFIFMKDHAGSGGDPGGANNNNDVNTFPWGNVNMTVNGPSEPVQIRGMRSIAEVREAYAGDGLLMKVQFKQNGTLTRIGNNSWYNRFDTINLDVSVSPYTILPRLYSKAVLSEVINFDDYFFNALGGNYVGTSNEWDPFDRWVTIAELDAKIASNNTYFDAVIPAYFSAAELGSSVYFGTGLVAEVVRFMADCLAARQVAYARRAIQYFMFPSDDFVQRILVDQEHLGMTTKQLKDLYAEQAPYYAVIAALTPAELALATLNYGLDKDRVDAAVAELERVKQLSELTDLKAEIDPYYQAWVDYLAAYAGPGGPLDPNGPTMPATDQPAYDDAWSYYNAWFMDKTDKELENLQVHFDSYVNVILPSYPAALRAEIFPGGTAYVTKYYNEIMAEVLRRGLPANPVQPYYQFYNDILSDGKLEKKGTAELLQLYADAITNKGDFYTIMAAEYPKIGTVYTQQAFDNIFTSFLPKIDEAIDMLAKVLAARLEANVNTVVDQIGGGAMPTKVTYENVARIRMLLGNLVDDNANIFAVFQGTGYLSPELEAAYLAINTSFYEEYRWFITNMAVDKYAQIKPGDLDPGYPLREPWLQDLARHGNEDYAVSDALMDETFRKLENLIMSKSFADLACMDIGGCIGSLPNMLYNDGIINSIVSYAYPFLLDYAEEYLLMLPDQNNASNNDALGGTIKKALDDAGASIGCNLVIRNLHLKSLHELLGSPAAHVSNNGLRTLAWYPDQFGDLLPAEYAEAKFTLSKMSTKSATYWKTYPTNAWKDPSILTNGSLKLNWHIDDAPEALKEEQFRKALAAALQPLWPVLKTMLAGQRQNLDTTLLDSSTPQISAMGCTINVNDLAAQIQLSPDGSGSRNPNLQSPHPSIYGYSTILTPFFEGLTGCNTRVPTMAQLAAMPNARALVDAIFNPLVDGIDFLSRQPLSAVVEILPNLAYMLVMNTIMPALETLKLDLAVRMRGSVRVTLAFIPVTINLWDGDVPFGLYDISCAQPLYCSCFQVQIVSGCLIGDGCYNGLQSLLGSGPAGIFDCLLGGSGGCLGSLMSCLGGGGGCLDCIFGGGGGSCEIPQLPCLNMGRMLQYGQMTTPGTTKRPTPVEWKQWSTKTVPNVVPIWREEIEVYDLEDSNGNKIPILDANGKPVAATWGPLLASAARDEFGNPVVYDFGDNSALAAPADDFGSPALLRDGTGAPIQDVEALTSDDITLALGYPGTEVPYLDDDGIQVLDGVSGDPLWITGYNVTDYYVYNFSYTFEYEKGQRVVTRYYGNQTVGSVTVPDWNTVTNGPTNANPWFHIEPDKGDQLLYLLRYLLGAINNPAIQGLLGGLLGGGSGGIMDVVGEILGGMDDPDMAIAALVEVFTPKPSGYYAMRKINWAYRDGANPKVQYSNTWTKADATFLGNIDGLKKFVDGIVKLLGVYDSNGNLYSIDGLLQELLGDLDKSIYSADLLNSIAGMLGGDLLGGLGLGDDIGGLIEQLIGVDLNAWSKFSDDYFDFEPGNRAAFVAGLLEMLRPIYPLLGFLLNSEDIEMFGTAVASSVPILDTNGNPVPGEFETVEGDPSITFSGYEGYAYGIIPLLEALGVKNVMTPAQYKAAIAQNPDAILTAILDPILDLVDGVLADPITGLLELLPNLIYFVDSGGLETSLFNVLHAALVLIDTIRPLYDLDLFGLLGGLAGDGSDDLIGMLLGLLTNGITMDGLINLVMGSGLLDSLIPGLNISLPPNSLDFLLSGTIKSFRSKNGLTAYRLEGNNADLITGAARFVVNFLFYGDNRFAIVDLLSDLVGMDLDFLKQVDAIINGLYPMFLGEGTDRVLIVLLNTFKALDVFVDNKVHLLDHRHKDWVAIVTAMKNSGLSFIEGFAANLENRLVENFGGFFDSTDTAQRGLIPFFSSIIAWLQKIWEWIISPFTWLFGLFG